MLTKWQFFITNMVNTVDVSSAECMATARNMPVTALIGYQETHIVSEGRTLGHLYF